MDLCSGATFPLLYIFDLLKQFSSCYWTWCFCESTIDPFLPNHHCSVEEAAPEPTISQLQAASYSCWHTLLDACLWHMPHSLPYQHAPIFSTAWNRSCSSTKVLPHMLVQIRWDCTNHHSVHSFMPALLLLSTATDPHLSSASAQLAFHPHQDPTPELLSLF